MNVLVTGGAGYIGSHAVLALSQHGHNPIVVDDLSYGHREAVAHGVPFYKMGIHETDAVAELMQKHKIECVMHFAAFIAVGESVREPLMYYQNNTAGALSLLLAAKKANVNKFVFSSTAATYGEPKEMPIRETTPQLPINPYGRSKLFVEHFLADYANANPEFAFTVLRYFNVAGAAENGSIGEDHKPETHIIPKILFAAIGKEDAITVFGTDYPTPDGTCVRDYVHVTDLVAAHLLAMSSMKKGNARFYNLGIGHGYSVKDILESAKRVTQRDIPVRYGERREGDPPALYASSELAQQELGWKPKYTEIDDILESAWKWHVAHPNGY